MTDKVRIAYCLRNGQLKVERHKHIVSGSEYGKRLEELPSEPDVDTNFEDYSRRELIEIYLNLKRQKDEQETSPEIVESCAHCAELEQKNQELRDYIELPKTTGYQILYEGAQEEIAQLKQQLAERDREIEELKAKLAQYEGMEPTTAELGA